MNNAYYDRKQNSLLLQSFFVKVLCIATYRKETLFVTKLQSPVQSQGVKEENLFGMQNSVALVVQQVGMKNTISIDEIIENTSTRGIPANQST